MNYMSHDNSDACSLSISLTAKPTSQRKIIESTFRKSSSVRYPLHGYILRVLYRLGICEFMITRASITRLRKRKIALSAIYNSYLSVSWYSMLRRTPSTSVLAKTCSHQRNHGQTRQITLNIKATQSNCAIQRYQSSTTVKVLPHCILTLLLKHFSIKIIRSTLVWGNTRITS